MGVLEYGRGLLGLDWMYSPLVLGLIRDKGRLLRSLEVACGEWLAEEGDRPVVLV